jgi:diacylglycerol kinase family enzyme
VEIRILDTGVSDWGYLALISNSRFYGGTFQINKDTSIDDGVLNVFLFKRGSVRDTFRLFLGVLTGTHGTMDNVAFHKGRKILILSKKKVFIQVDGDKAASPPLDITVRHRYLPVFVPAASGQPVTDYSRYIRQVLKQTRKEDKKPLSSGRNG